MISRDFIVPTFFANQLSIFGEMTLGMVVKILQVAADIENHAPDQSAAGQFDSCRAFRVDRAFLRMGVAEDVSHLLMIFQAAPGIVACIVSNPGNACDASQQIVRFGPNLRRPSVTFRFHVVEWRRFFRREKMRACGWLQGNKREFQPRSCGASELQ